MLAPAPLVITEWALLDAPTMSAAALESATRWVVPPHAPAPAAPPAAAEGKPPLVLRPNADGLVDLIAAAEPTPPAESVPNPFRVRWHPPLPARESILKVGGVLLAGRPENASVCLNGRIYSPGESVAGLTVATVSADTIELQAPGLKVLLPVREQPLRIRAPRP